MFPNLKSSLNDLSEFLTLDILTTRKGTIIFIFISFSMVAYWFFLINSYSVNILFYDHWDLYNAFFNNHDLLDLYLWQHGPHRQGIGFVLTKYIDEISDWDTLWISNTIGVLVVLSMSIYLVLKKKLFGKICLYDLVIVLIMLTPTQYGIFANTPNLSHGSMPIFIISLFCLSLFINSVSIKVTTLSILNFLIIYSGFGLLFGLITPIIFVLFFFFNRPNKYEKTIYFIGIILSCVSIMLFFSGYVHSPANPNFKFPHDQPFEYIVFILAMVKSAIGIRKVLGFVIGGVILFAVCYAFIKTLISIYMNKEFNNLQLITLLLIAFSLLFMIATAVGRVSFGIAAGTASRYVIYVIPSLIGLYLYIISNAQNKVLLLFLIPFSLSCLYSQKAIDNMKVFKSSKQEWKRVYLETNSINSANNSAKHYKIYPNPPSSTQLKKKLNYLKERELNLFKEN